MANEQKGEVSLLDGNGKIWTLRPSLNALCMAEERTGKSTADLMLQASLGSMIATRAVLWSYLQKYHAKDFDTFEKVGSMIDDIGLDSVNTQLQKLMKINEPPENATVAVGKAEQPGRPLGAQAGVGAVS